MPIIDILLTVIHLSACFILIIIVLLQTGKGADLAGAFGGGGSQTALGVRTATQLIHKLTIAAAVFFLLTSYTLGLIQSSTRGLIEEIGSAGAQQQATAPATENSDKAGESQDKEPVTPAASPPGEEQDPGLSDPNSNQTETPRNEEGTPPPPSEEEGPGEAPGVA